MSEQLDKAIAFSREADDARHAAYKSGDKAEIAAAHARCANTQANLLAALDAAQGQAVAWQSVRGGRLYLSRHDAVLNGEQMVTPLYAAPPAAAVPEPEGEVLTNLWTDEQCREFCRVAFRHRHQPGLPTQTTLDDIRYGAHFAMLAAAERKGGES